MGMQYRVDMFPLEPYTFGTEQGSKFKGVAETGKESYIVASGAIPEQTTILGTLRYLVLQEKGFLKPDFCYEKAEKEQVEEAIGKNSFSFQEKEPQSFGVIKQLSPLFLTEHGKAGKEPEIYIKNPFNNKGREGRYEPMKLTEETFATSYGPIRLPRVMDGDKISPEYDAKEGYGSGYLCLSGDRKAAPKDLFSWQLLTGNRIEREAGREGFFKREAVILKNGFAFSVFLEMEEDLFSEENDASMERIAFMGYRQSAFRFRFTKMEKKQELDQMVKRFFREGAGGGKETGCWQYALSDLYLAEPLHYNKGFAIVAEKSLRTLHTDIGKSRYIDKRKKSVHQFHLIESGSVFYGEELKGKLENENAKTIGYNVVVSIGGK